MLFIYHHEQRFMVSDYSVSLAAKSREKNESEADVDIAIEVYYCESCVKTTLMDIYFNLDCQAVLYIL